MSAPDEALGSFGAAVISKTLRHHGCRLFSAEDPFERGDGFMNMPGGSLVFRDDKAKSASTFYRKWQREQHGIDKRQYDHYRKICQQHNVRGFIALYERGREISASTFSPFTRTCPTRQSM